VKVQRSGSLASAATAKLVSSALTATPGADKDYVELFGTARNVSFAAGVATDTLEISIVDDVDAESAETFQLEVKTPSAGSGIGTQKIAVVTIEDND
jgi:hypothetical protein